MVVAVRSPATILPGGGPLPDGDSLRSDCYVYAELLAPEPEDDFYVLKPSHSGFFRTGLEVLLERLEARTLVLTGFAGDICVLFTATDAYMRGFDVVVPADCIASERAEDNDHALHQMARLPKARVARSDALNLNALRAGKDAARTG